MGVISYEYGFFSYMFIAVFALLSFNSLRTKKYIFNFVALIFIILSFINCYYNSISKLAEHIDENIEITAKIKDKNVSESSYSSYNAVILPYNENTIIYFIGIEIVIVLYMIKNMMLKRTVLSEQM